MRILFSCKIEAFIVDIDDLKTMETLSKVYIDLHALVLQNEKKLRKFQAFDYSTAQRNVIKKNRDTSPWVHRNLHIKFL